MSEEVKEKGKKSAQDELQEMQLQVEREKLEMLKLEKLERQLNLEDLKQRLEERQIKKEQLKTDREAQGRTIAQQRATDAHRQKICTHRKGGNVSTRDLRALFTGGSSQQRSVFKHIMINGDMWVRCSRCGKTWSPPVEENFYFDDRGRVVPKKLGRFNQAAFDQAVREYQEACAFETNNTTSGSVQARFSKVDEDGRVVDAALDYRRNLKDTNLR